ncbi:CRISPR-associated endoribonuclease Cas2 [bioreactor metagenome]|jgi:CRISPR-associated protein Cas2|uniref:CRISPR-associated endoribonuclease Cas2 n=1 Tax=bioreactor metagenome TaxID=1076179 RepID=A0A644VTN0_9ZZZZ|nr:CRISPR-associated endonuclease Cas2 [Paludibacter sp.]
MPRKKKEPPGFVEIMRKLTRAGITGSAVPNRTITHLEEITTLEERVEKILGIIKQDKRPAGNMIFFVMYDIEDDKVRRQVFKYLLKLGCYRVQRSVFLADLPNSKYDQIRKDLTEVQAAYDNNDSILVVPISTDYLTAMKIIGQTIDIDVITKTRNTLFF